MHKEICKGHINITFVVFNVNIVFKFWLSRWKNLKFKWQLRKNKGLHWSFYLLWSPSSLSLKKYPRPSHYPVSLHSVLPTYSVDDTLVKLRSSIMKSLTFFHPSLHIHLYYLSSQNVCISFLPVVMVTLF